MPSPSCAGSKTAASAKTPSPADFETAQWPAHLQHLKGGHLSALLPGGSELWLDGGHNADAGVVLADALSAMARKDGKPLTLVWGMLNTKDASQLPVRSQHLPAG